MLKYDTRILVEKVKSYFISFNKNINLILKSNYNNTYYKYIIVDLI